ncbi:GntR family transcriptional regulator [uncultured Shimia sp.]|uniref:GntR family transcriptional regulator n=1 Tax=uncultured Shimia sp. TaxID=573152 RepID=UPI002631D7D9|nr:GntR family transcriptional regulator [uncultured Shimia sp.]
MTDSTRSRKERLATHLRKSILTLELMPGSDLDEVRLSEQFALSRTPLREVFRDLAGEGYLSHRANRGVRVSELSHTTLRAFFQAAPMIYSAVLQLAALNATAAQIDALKEVQARFLQALKSGSVAERSLANYRFHEITGEMSGNLYLLPSMQRLLIDHARIGMTFYRPQTQEMSNNLGTASSHHDAIIEAIESRNGEAAGRLAMEHWQLSRSQIESFVMPDGLDAQLGLYSEKKSA